MTSAVPLALGGDPRRRLRERIIRATFLAAALVSLVVSLLIVLVLAVRAVDFLASIELTQLFADGWFPRRGRFDVATLLVGTLIVSGVALLVAAPAGLATAVYLSEYARPRTRRLLKPALEVLAAVPSIVLGYFALTWVNPNVVRLFFPDASGFNLLAAGLGVGVLTVPLVASVAEDALRAVPGSLREAAYGLGARRVSVSFRVVLPAASSGVVAALVLGISRAVGETMVVAVASGGSGGALFSLDPTRPGQTLTAAMAALATGSDQVVGDTAAFQSLFFLGLVLFLLTLGLNQLGGVLVRRVSRHAERLAR